jgi:hypothetical protein
LKIQLKGYVFGSTDELFILFEWERHHFLGELMNKHCSSFNARLQGCSAHDGEPLNGHCKEVHLLHHSPLGDSSAPEPKGNLEEEGTVEEEEDQIEKDKGEDDNAGKHQGK